MKTLVSALILSASFIGAAQAGELDYPPALDTHSSVTRAQVQQELAAARANGELVSGEEGYAVATFVQTGDKTRAQVQQELAAARAQGLTESGELDYPPVRG
ncbi:DUF4148 domain-containing protein [Achromobacter sp. Marseille-Q0513]|jgi:hypothetical protein|uniref:DUF4148 domain-containing protein n=1 Tax=Achromobacter sp. Marseille-Q0513 TaxID=2829161 RepID=UPI001B8E15F7|nr:DUF4148 domain-containing protein [Achromobacter sp. Marseille-Q0513]MBR8652311.1 DUF4148 domain-containing protein [Achromobacter sp. Marseille-Q0513]